MNKTDNKNPKTKQHLLKAAREEFFEKGYDCASMRSICGRAKLTTGALYFFYKDKKDLLNAVISPLLEEITALMTEHYIYENEHVDNLAASSQTLKDAIMDNSEDIEASIKVVRVMYKYRQECLLFLSTREVSTPFIDGLIDASEKHYAELFATLSGVENFDHYIIHWLTHLQIDSFIHLFLHEEDEEVAVSRVPIIIGFITNGFYNMVEQVRNKK